MLSQRDQKEKHRDGVRKEYHNRATGTQGGLSEPGMGSANYAPEELAAAEEVYSFGCGNPLAFSHIEPGQRVLDLGCGAGLDLILAAERVGKSGEVVGIDMTQGMLDRARKNIAKSGHQNITVHEGVIEDLPLASDSFDWVISNCVVSLSPDKPRVFAEIARVLKPGGRMLISDIVVEDVPDWVRVIARRFNPAVAAAIGEEIYVAGLKEAGMGAVEIKARHPYDRATLLSMIRSDLVEGNGPWLLRKAGATLAAPVANAAAGKVVSIKVFAQRLA